MIKQIINYLESAGVASSEGSTSSSLKTIQDAKSNFDLSKFIVATPKVSNYASTRTNFDEKWERPEFNFYEIDRFQIQESFLSISFDKKLCLFLKEGYEIVSANKEYADYIEKRLSEICSLSRTTLTLLVANIARNIIKYSNCIVAIKRDETLSGGKSYKIGATEYKPISSLEILPTSMVQVQTNSKSIPIKYRQFAECDWKKKDTNPVAEYSPKDIIHFVVNRTEGNIFGTPRCWQALEDIKALRRIETDIEIHIHKNVFPITQWRVGTDNHPAGILPDGYSEVDATRKLVEGTPPEGIYVTSERHEILLKGAEGHSIRAETYLDYFKKRVLSGLHLSGVDIGDGETANRSTAAQMSRSLMDIVKSDQILLEEQLFLHLLLPLLIEMPDEKLDWLDQNNHVYLKFKEIDTDNQIKKENATVQLLTNNLVTFEEARLRINEAPFTDEEWIDTFYKKVKEPAGLTGGATSATSPIAHAAVDNPHTPIESSHLNKATQQERSNFRLQKSLSSAKKKT